MRGRSPGAMASSARTPQAPIRKPRMPPAKASTTLSVEQLPHDAHATGADGGANGHLPLPRGRARQLQVGDIRASDQQHEAHRAQQDQSAAISRRPPGLPAAASTATLSVLSIHFGLAWRNRSPTIFICALAACNVTPGFRRPATSR